MRTFLSKTNVLALLVFLAVGLIGCSAGGGDMGRLSMSLTDKPTHDYEQVWVTIGEISAHLQGDPEGSWTKVLDVNRTVDLLTLANGVRLELGLVDLAAGHYTQMRFVLGTANSVDAAKPANYIVDGAGEIREMTVPSGVQSGIKLVQGFDINENSTTELVFDFDVAASIVASGNSGKYLLRPTIHQIDDSQTRTIINGTVLTKQGAAIPGAEVSLQVYKPRAEGQDYRDEIVGPYSTVTDGAGAYQFWFLDVPEATTFNVVAANWTSTDPYYGPDWAQVPGAMNGNVYNVDDPAYGGLALPVPAEIGSLDLKAIVADSDMVKVDADTLVVTLSIRQLSDLAGAPLVEVKKQLIVGYDDEWTIGEITAVKVDLPVGDYAIVASTDGRASVEKTITITKAGPNAIDFTFPAI